PPFFIEPASRAVRLSSGPRLPARIAWDAAARCPCPTDSGRRRSTCICRRRSTEPARNSPSPPRSSRDSAAPCLGSSWRWKPPFTDPGRRRSTRLARNPLPTARTDPDCATQCPGSVGSVRRNSTVRIDRKPIWPDHNLQSLQYIGRVSPTRLRGSDWSGLRAAILRIEQKPLRLCRIHRSLRQTAEDSLARLLG